MKKIVVFLAFFVAFIFPHSVGAAPNINSVVNGQSAVQTSTLQTTSVTGESIKNFEDAIVVKKGCGY